MRNAKREARNVASKKQLSVVFCAAKPPKARSEASRRLAETKTQDYATVEKCQARNEQFVALRQVRSGSLGSSGGFVF